MSEPTVKDSPDPPRMDKYITYVKGDATCPQLLEGLNPHRLIIAHIVNNSGGWGRGFVLPLGRKYPLAETAYRAWHAGTASRSWYVSQGPFGLGYSQFVRVDANIAVMNMCAQDGYVRPERQIPLDYPALKSCMQQLLAFSHECQASIHMPRIGCGLGGGNWNQILDTIYDAWVDQGSAFKCPPIVVYDLD